MNSKKDRFSREGDSVGLCNRRYENIPEHIKCQHLDSEGNRCMGAIQVRQPGSLIGDCDWCGNSYVRKNGKYEQYNYSEVREVMPFDKPLDDAPARFTLRGRLSAI